MPPDENIVTPPAPTPAPAKSETFSREYVTELREEAKTHRLATEAANKAKADAEAAAAKAIADAQAASETVSKTANERIIRAELKAAAIKAGIVDLDALKMLDVSSVKVDENGEVVGADALIEGAKAAKPYLFGQPSTSSTAPTPKPTPATNKSARDMTPQEAKNAARLLGISEKHIR